VLLSPLFFFFLGLNGVCVFDFFVVKKKNQKQKQKQKLLVMVDDGLL